MTAVKVTPGCCGLDTTVQARSDDMQFARVEIKSACPHIMAMAHEIELIDSFIECFVKIGEGQVYRAARRYGIHPMCPVPCAVLKCVEAECRLAVPRDVEIRFIPE